MKRFLYLFVIVFLLLLLVVLITLLQGSLKARSQLHLVPSSFNQQYTQLKTGDLVLYRASDAPFLRLCYTGSGFTHVSMIYRDDTTHEVYILASHLFTGTDPIHVRGFLEEYESYTAKGHLIAVRHLNRPLAKAHQSQLRTLVHGIQQQKSSAPGNKSQTSRLIMIKYALEWISTRILNHRGKRIEASKLSEHLLCTDFVAWVLTWIQLLHGAAGPLTPDYFATEQINQSIIIPGYFYEKDIYWLRR